MKQELLQKLQKQIRELSCNSLRRIYPEQLQEWSGATNKEIKEFIAELLDERLIDCKYDFQCSCGSNCTAYQQSIEMRNYQCSECERIYELDEILDKGTLLYELDKRALLDYGEEEIDYKNIVKDVKKIVMMPIKQEEENVMNKKKIFLGSSSEAVKIMEDIAYQLQILDCDTLRWNEDGKNIFPAGHNIIDSLIEITKMVDAAVFVFNEDDKIWNKKSSVEGMNVVRDNVLLEYGLFAGVLGKEKVCMICRGNVHIPSDLLGVKYIDGTKGDMIIKKQLEDWINAM